MLVVSKFTYTLETIIQAGKLLVAVDHVPVHTNPKTRESRLFPSTGAYVRRNAVSIFRIYAQYEPLRVFWSLALLIGLVAIGVWVRFAVAYAEGSGSGSRSVPDPRRGAVHRGRRPVGARRDRRPARRPARDDAEDLRARAPDRARARRGPFPLRTRRGPRYGTRGRAGALERCERKTGADRRPRSGRADRSRAAAERGRACERRHGLRATGSSRATRTTSTARATRSYVA